MLTSLALALLLGAAPAVTDSVRADAEIRQTVLRNANDVRACYVSQGLARNPALKGMLELELTILPTGRVDSVAVVDARLAGPGAVEVARCIATAARHWRFERGPYAIETVILPFDLAPETERSLARHQPARS